MNGELFSKYSEKVRKDLLEMVTKQVPKRDLKSLQILRQGLEVSPDADKKPEVINK